MDLSFNTGLAQIVSYRQTLKVISLIKNYIYLLSPTATATLRAPAMNTLRASRLVLQDRHFVLGNQLQACRMRGNDFWRFGIKNGRWSFPTFGSGNGNANLNSQLLGLGMGMKNSIFNFWDCNGNEISVSNQTWERIGKRVFGKSLGPEFPLIPAPLVLPH